MKTLLLSILTFLSVQCKESTHNASSTGAAGSEELQEPIIKVINKTDYKKAVDGQTVQLVDVRTPDEYSGGHIKGAININIYDNYFENKISKLDKSKPVYIYCRSGARSQMAANQMKRLGFTSIIDLKGGYMNY